MHRFLVSGDVLQSDCAVFDRALARHLQTVLRVKAGESICFFDGEGKTREFLVEEVQRSGMRFSAVGDIVRHPRSKCDITLYVSLIKRLDWVIEKATEIGASIIQPVETARSVVKVAKDDIGKTERWGKIAEEALRQCGGAWLPRVPAVKTFSEALEEIKSVGAPLFVGALAGDTTPMLKAMEEFECPAQTALFIGPEGDFSPEELSALLQCGVVRPVTLGSRVLRAETACVYGLSLLSAKYL